MSLVDVPLRLPPHILEYIDRLANLAEVSRGQVVSVILAARIVGRPVDTQRNGFFAASGGSGGVSSVGAGGAGVIFGSWQRTPWFPADVKPVRQGVYERVIGAHILRNRWDGGTWVSSTTGLVVSQQNLPWRGLAAPPSPV